MRHPHVARFAEIGLTPLRSGDDPAVAGHAPGPDPIAALIQPSPATAAMERWHAAYEAAFDTGDFSALYATVAPGCTFNDRRRMALVSGGSDLMVASLREREAFARWIAIEPELVQLPNFFESQSGWAEGDRSRVGAVFADEVLVEDHRRTGFGRIDGREAYLRSVDALWRFAPGSRMEMGWIWLAWAPHGGVTTGRRSGTWPDGGGEHLSDFLIVLVTEGSLATRLELFEIDDVEAALARFAELSRGPTNVLPNPTTR